MIVAGRLMLQQDGTLCMTGDILAPLTHMDDWIWVAVTAYMPPECSDIGDSDLWRNDKKPCIEESLYW